MNDASLPSTTARSWVRLSWSPESGVDRVSGDSTAVLGIPARRLINSAEPLLLLPPELVAVLSEGVPEVPVSVRSSTFSGTISPSNGVADLVLFEGMESQGGGGIMLNELGAGVVVTDRTGVIVLWNKTMSSMFRVPERHAIGKRLQDVLVAPLLYSWENVITMALEDRQVRVECRPDSQRRVESTFAPGGAGVVGTCFDTTESFQAERRLRTSRRMNQAYFHSVSTGLVLFDKDYRILVANRAFGRIFGLVENLLGIHLHEILPRESFAVLEDQTQPVFTETTDVESTPRTVRFVLPDGNEKVITQTASSIVEDSGEVFYAVGIFEDNTRTVMTEEELKLCRDRIRRVAAISKERDSGRLLELDGTANMVRECFSARAAAIYLFEPMNDTELAGSAGDWPEAAPETFSELRFASFPLESRPGCRLSGDETGVLGTWFSNCLVFPIETDRRSGGYLIVADVNGPVGPAEYNLAEIAARLIGLTVCVNTGEMEKEQLNILLDRQRRMAGTILTTMDVPAALFRVDWSVIDWNRAMEELTGIPADVAVNRAEMGANLLFHEIGGISTAQRLARKGLTEFPEAWEVTSIDGKVTMCSWRLSGAESAERGNIEPVMILVGTKVGDLFSMKAAKHAADTYQALSRAISGLLSAATRNTVVEITAGAFQAISGASRVELRLRGSEPVSRGVSDVSTESLRENEWKLSLETDSSVIGECNLTGGRNSPLLEEFASNAARMYAALEKNAIGQRFAVLADRTAGRFLITDSGGRVLLSTWLEATEGNVTGMNLADIFDETEQLSGFIQGVLKAGRLDLQLTPKGGSPFRAASVAINGHEGEPLLFWWPISSPGYIEHHDCGDSARRAGERLNEILAEMSASIARGFRRIKETLNPDNPVSATLTTARYAFDAIGKAFQHQRLLRRAWSHLPERLPPESILEAVTNNFLTEAMQPPDFTIVGELRELSGDFELLSELVTRITRLFSPGYAPRITAEIRATDQLDRGAVGPGSSDFFLELHLISSGGNALKGIDGQMLVDCDPDTVSNLDPISEMSLLALSLRLAGGRVLVGNHAGELTLLLPCWS